MNDIVACDASWNIDLNVDCPHCGYGFDVTDYITMSDLPDCGKATNECNIDLSCPECSRDFIITEIKS